MSSRTLFSDHVCVCVYIYIYITSHRNGEVGGMEFLGVFSFSIYLTIQNCVVWLLHGSKWNSRFSVVYCDIVGCLRGAWQLDWPTICLVLIWLSHNFALWLFGCPTIFSFVYLAVPQFSLMFIWLSHNFVLCLFWCPTVFPCDYLAAAQYCLMFIRLTHSFPFYLFGFPIILSCVYFASTAH